jgi:translocation and assembly module TamB
MIRYGVGMFEAVNTVTLKYQIHKNLYAEVISGKSNAFDLLYSFTRD